MNAETTRVEIREEVRFAVVMYGGVSLAIYINGVAQELLHMVRATATTSDGTALLVDEPSGTESVYRELGTILGCEDGEKTGSVRTRFVVDILSGTSAGGINAVYLAKALANGQDMKRLERLWIQEGDIRKLINDTGSVRDIKGLARQDPPGSLLNGQRMYLKLLEAFDEMDGEGATSNPPYAKELDLFVTATDIHGLPTLLRLADGIVPEKRHRNVFRFRYSDGSTKKPVNDFHKDNNRFLAFAARCTSAFPFAFEPMRFDGMGPLLGEKLEDHYERWKEFFPEYLDHSDTSARAYSFADRPFGDGGYLDNKPFGHATDAMATRRRGLPVRRKLVYIEPTPENLEPEEEKKKKPDEGPDAVENVLTALSLARYETIREDLQRILERNRLSDRVAWAVSGMEDDLAGDSSGFEPRSDDDYGTMDLGELITARGFGYGAYHRVRVMALTDELAAVVSYAAGFETDTDEYLAIRYLVRAWRNKEYATYLEPGKKPESSFLLEYDLPFRLRRLEFVLDKISALLRLQYSPNKSHEAVKILKHYLAVNPGAKTVIEPSVGDKGFYTELKKLREELGEVFAEAREDRDELLLSSVRNPLHEAVMEIGLTRKELCEMLDEPDEDRRLKHAEAMLDEHKEFGRVVDELKKLCAAGSYSWDGEPADDGTAVAGDIVSHYYEYAVQYDSISFPIYYTTEVGQEFTRVDVTRISPLDATSLINEREGRKKLAGTKIRNFGAFLDEGWRRNDLLWGRLDGAERIITALLPNPSQKEKRDALIEKAHEEILGDYVNSRDLDKMYRVLAEAVAKAPPSSGGSEEALRELARRPNDGTLELRVQDALQGSLEPKPLREYLRNGYQPNWQMNREDAARSLARSTRVTGQVLGTITEKYPLGGRFSVWLARLGWLSSGIMEVSVTRSFWSFVFGNWLKLLYVLGALMVVGGFLLTAPQVQRFGLILLAVTVVSHVGALSVGGWIRRRRSRWVRGALALSVTVLAVALISLAYVGADAMFDLGRLDLVSGDWKVGERTRP